MDGGGGGGGGGAEEVEADEDSTLTETLLISLPELFVHLMEYDVVWAGETDSVPETGFVPYHPPPEA